MREYFCAYHSMLDATRKLSDAEVGRLFRGLLQYSMTKEQPHGLQGREAVVFDIFSQQIDREIARYEKTCQTNRMNASQRTGANGNDSQRVATTRSDSQRRAAKTCDSLQEEKEEKRKEKREEKDHDDDNARVNSIAAYASGCLQYMSPGNLDELSGYMEILPDDLIRFAIDEACGNGAPRWAYASRILQGYVRDGIRTVGDAKAAKDKRSASKAVKDTIPQAHNFTERANTDDDYASVLIDLTKGAE